jgi:ABC-type phosphate transport system substrate-binding protein
LRRLGKGQGRISVITFIGTLLALFGSVLMQGTAKADYGPGSYDQTIGKGDVVCVGSDTVQYLGDFLADGDQNAHAGFNSSKPTYKLVNIDATADANARLSYAQTQTVQSPALLDPNVILRAGSPPVIRPNGSGAGMKALMADVTATANEKINCVRTSSFPGSITISSGVNAYQAAQNNGWGGLHVVRAATDPLSVMAAQTTNAPPGLSAAQLSQIYNITPTVVTWGDLGAGYSGPCSTCHIVPLLPQSGSGTRSTFLADLLAANPSFICCAPSVQQFVEENDPTAITSNADPTDAIVPFSGGRLNLWNSGYFHNPHTPYSNNPFPGGATLVPGIAPVTGTTTDGSAVYLNQRGLYISWRAIDDSLPSWQPGSTLNWAQTLFSGGGTSFLGGFKATNPIKSSGETTGYKDCGIDPASTSVC